MSVDWDRIGEMEAAKGVIDTQYPQKAFEEELYVSGRLAGMMDVPWSSALDFGCGVGRNLRGLLDGWPGVRAYAYDFPNMLAMAKVYLEQDWKKVIYLEPPVENLRWLRVDLIIASLVFQHIPINELRLTLEALKEVLKKNGRLYVASRGWMDEGRANVWSLILEQFEPVTELDAADATSNHQVALFKRLK